MEIVVYNIHCISQLWWDFMVLMDHSNDINALMLIFINKHAQITKILDIPDVSVRNLAEVPQTDLDNNCAKFQNDWSCSSRETGGRIGPLSSFMSLK